MNAKNKSINAERPEVLVLGDSIVDLFVYDNGREDVDKSLDLTSPLSWDDWNYTKGFEARKCMAGAAAIHAMLWENNIAVNGNSFPDKSESSELERTGSIFVLRERLNPGKNKEERTRKYLEISRIRRDDPNQGEKKAAEPASNQTGGEDKGEADEFKRDIQAREKTWRAADNLLSKSTETYVRSLQENGLEGTYSTDHLKAICLLDVNRGYFRNKDKKDTGIGWQDDLLKFYGALCKNNPNLPIIIRTPDPSRFKHFLKNLPNKSNSPTVVLICSLAQLNEGDLRGSGTWREIWSQVYDYLNRTENNYLHVSTAGEKVDWRFHIVVAIHQDGIMWFGPGVWPLSEEDQAQKFLRKDFRPLGKLFGVPGSQPGLSEFEQNSPMIGVHTLLTYATVEHFTEGQGIERLDDVIKRAQIRIRRLCNHGYCAIKEMTPIAEVGKPSYHIGYPRAVWKNPEREFTDLLLKVRHEKTGQNAGPFEVECKIDRLVSTPAGSPSSYRIANALIKKVHGDFVASVSNCYDVINDIPQGNIFFGLNCDKCDKDDSGTAQDLKNGYWIKFKDNPPEKKFPLDSFAYEEIESFRLRQRISMQFGDFAMANPDEAGSLLDLAQRIKQHIRKNRHSSPPEGKVFNFALFGSPGSGKSFLAGELAKSIDPKNEIFSKVEHNLSQFTETNQLRGALEAIASKSVGGKVPFVLWDEFDSVFEQKRGGWLARFLMPMQDAHFFDGHEKRPIGTAVFVFIGGTFPTAEDFRRWACETKMQNGSPSEAVLLKGRDFHSRLYTALDMPSIIDEEKNKEDPSTRPIQIFRTEWESDFTKLARAVLLREFLKRNSKVGEKIFLKTVDPDLCRFLLAIPLRHGARSLERIVEACLVSKPRDVTMLHLPPQHFLAEHIETENVRKDDRKTKGMTIDEMKVACTSCPGKLVRARRTFLWNLILKKDGFDAAQGV